MSQATEFVQVQVADGVAFVTLNRPDVHNAFNDQVIRELTDAFEAVGARADVRVVVLRAEGKSFCAGADLTWMQKMVDYSFEENVADAMALARMLKTIHDCPKPVIARVHGAAFGGGVGLIAACDMAIALEPAVFCLSEVKLGLLPAVISPFVLRKIPASAAHRYFLTAERFDAPQALRLGLVSEVVASIGEMDAWIAQVTAAIKTNGPEAVRHAKSLIDTVLDFDWERAMAKTAELIAERRASKEGQEGMQAFLAKRNPAWIEPAAG